MDVEGQQGLLGSVVVVVILAPVLVLLIITVAITNAVLSMKPMVMLIGVVPIRPFGLILVLDLNLSSNVRVGVSSGSSGAGGEAGKCEHSQEEGR